VGSDRVDCVSRALGSITFPANFMLVAAMKQLSLSARAFHRILKLARTSADLAGSETIAANHLAEALQYRPRDHL
jgi:magnesium chelatase family protein